MNSQDVIKLRKQIIVFRIDLFLNIMKRGMQVFIGEYLMLTYSFEYKVEILLFVGFSARWLWHVNCSSYQCPFKNPVLPVQAKCQRVLEHVANEPNLLMNMYNNMDCVKICAHVQKLTFSFGETTSNGILIYVNIIAKYMIDKCIYIPWNLVTKNIVEIMCLRKLYHISQILRP